MTIEQDKIAATFAVFHTTHPWVYDHLRELALAMRRAGVSRYGIAGLYETLRYQLSVKNPTDEGFKLNNNYMALYARELARREPELLEFFQFRERKPRGTQSSGRLVDAFDQPLEEGEVMHG